MFSYVLIERGLSWYKEILELSLPDNRELNINPRNCVGTVLALNGHRKYFCMFHAKHTEHKKSSVSVLNIFNLSLCTFKYNIFFVFYFKSIQNKSRTATDCEAAAFIESDTSESDEEVLLQGDLLDGLPNWLDRLFEGTTQRYHINYWPEFPNK